MKLESLYKILTMDIYTNTTGLSDHICKQGKIINDKRGLVSKETVVLHRWGVFFYKVIWFYQQC